MKRIALLGECLIELNGEPFGALQQTFGGDTLNTALYLARLTRGSATVKYVTALGADPLSEGMLERWQTEGIDTGLVLRDATRLPGLYLIQIDGRGERTFLYWRGQSAARHLLQHPDFEHVERELVGVDLVFLSGISLAILPAHDRTKLIELLTRLAAKGIPVGFDTNYRARLWSSPQEARETIAQLLPATDLVFATFEDEQQLWGDRTADDAIARLHAAGTPRVVLKMGAEGCLFCDRHSITKVPTRPVTNVVDTTAAGDSFNAGFLAGWIAERSAEECCRAGNALAGIVIQYRGAIIPASVMPATAALF